MIKAIFFDLDGVVVSHAKIFSDYLQEEYGIDKESQLEFFKGEFQDCLVGKADLKEEIIPYMQKWGWKGSVEDLLDYWFDVEAKTDERVLAMVQKLRERGIKCYLATNQEKYRTVYVANEMGLSKVFDGIFSSASVGYIKNNHKFFEIVLSEIGNPKPEEVMFWDDSIENVEIAKSLGIKAELYIGFEDFKEKMIAYLTNPLV